MTEDKNTRQDKFAIRVTLFVFMLTLYFMSYFHRVAVPGTIFNELQSDFNATATEKAAMNIESNWDIGY